MVLGTAVFAVVAACSANDGIPRASVDNVIDSSTTLSSLATGPLQAPTAYSLNARAGVRTWDVGTNFEFAYTTDPSGRSYFLPLDVLGLTTSSVKPGLKPSAIDFDQLTIAPRNGYTTSDSIQIAVGETYFVRSGINACSALSVPLYGKLKVLAIDTVLNTVTFEAMANQNCGYRALTLGIPRQ